MKWMLALLFAGSLCAASDPRIFYSKSFPKSVPEYFQVTLQKDGGVEYAEATDDPDPIRFKLNEADTSEVFGLLEKTDNLKSAVDTPKRVAFMGAKTLRFEDGEKKAEARFNYSEDVATLSLVDWFERMSQSARDRIDLERTMKFDKLGVYQAVVNLQSDISRKRVAGIEQFLPILDRLAKNESFMHTVRQRAAEIAEGIRKGQ